MITKYRCERCVSEGHKRDENTQIRYRLRGQNQFKCGLQLLWEFQVCPVFTPPLVTAAKTASKRWRHKCPAWDEGRPRGGRGVSGWTEEGGGGNISIDGCGNDHVNSSNYMLVKECSQRRQGSFIKVVHICSQMHVPGYRKVKKSTRNGKKAKEKIMH